MDVPQYVQHKGVERWVAEMTELCRPADVYWCDGSDEEFDRLCEELVAAGTFIPAQRRAATEQASSPGRCGVRSGENGRLARGQRRGEV